MLVNFSIVTSFSWIPEGKRDRSPRLPMHAISLANTISKKLSYSISPLALLTSLRFERGESLDGV
jgi:hypothetical protein